MKLLAPLIACALCAVPAVFAVAQPAAVPLPADPTAPATPTDQKGITEITLQRIPGFVRPPAPVYKVTFYSDGRATAIMGNSESSKSYTGFINARDFKHLAEFVEQAKFFDLEPLYTTNVTDLGTVVTSVVKDGTRKDVRDYAYQGPTNLWSLEKVLGGLAADMKWKEVAPEPATTAPATQPMQR